MLLFRLYEKVTKKYTKGPRPSGLPGYSSKFRAVNYLLKHKLSVYQEILAKIVVLCHTARRILNRCERVILLRKELRVFRRDRLWFGRTVGYVFPKKGEFGEKLFLRGQIPVLRKREGLVGSCFVANRKKFFGKQIVSDRTV